MFEQSSLSSSPLQHVTSHYGPQTATVTLCSVYATRSFQVNKQVLSKKLKQTPSQRQGRESKIDQMFAYV